MYNPASVINIVHLFNDNNIPGAAAEANQMVQKFLHGKVNLDKSLNAFYQIFPTLPKKTVNSSKSLCYLWQSEINGTLSIPPLILIASAASGKRSIFIVKGTYTENVKRFCKKQNPAG